MSESLRDRVARVLAEHRTFGKVNVQDEPMTHQWFCSCGWATEPALYAEPEVPLSVFLKFQHEADALIAAGLVADRASLIQESAAMGFDTAIRSLTYSDGTPVEVVSVANPYRAVS